MVAERWEKTKSFEVPTGNYSELSKTGGDMQKSVLMVGDIYRATTNKERHNK